MRRTTRRGRRRDHLGLIGGARPIMSACRSGLHALPRTLVRASVVVAGVVHAANIPNMCLHGYFEGGLVRNFALGNARSDTRNALFKAARESYRGRVSRRRASQDCRSPRSSSQFICRTSRSHSSRGHPPPACPQKCVWLTVSIKPARSALGVGIGQPPLDRRRPAFRRSHRPHPYGEFLSGPSGERLG